MRFIVLGAGAIGDVLLIDRRAHDEAIASEGLTLETPPRKCSSESREDAQRGSTDFQRRR
jgi:hypothetical protein